MNAPNLKYPDTTGRVAIFNPNVAITYGAQIVNATTGEVIGCGATIPSGTHIKYQFTQQAATFGSE